MGRDVENTMAGTGLKKCKAAEEGQDFRLSEELNVAYRLYAQ